MYIILIIHEKTYNPNLFFFPKKACPTLVVHSSSPSWGGNGLYGTDYVLTNECDAVNTTNANFFLAEQGARDGYVTLDLGCTICIASIILKNTHGFYDA